MELEYDPILKEYLKEGGGAVKNHLVKLSF